MSRPVWKGNISFGLVSIPVTLFSAENPSELHFHLLDSRNKARIRYERVNEETGKEVPWDKIVKAYEFEKGNYVVVDEKELEKVAYENFQTIDIEDFIDKDALPPLYYEKPYYLEPNKQNEKGYLVLRDTLEKLNKIAIAKVVIKTRQHLAAVFPYKERLVLNILRFNNELKKPEAFYAPDEKRAGNKVSEKELKMAEKLIQAMSSKWDPKKYHDKNRELLQGWIEGKIQHKKSVVSVAKESPKGIGLKHGKSAKIVDFMTLLKKSVEAKEKKGMIRVSSSSGTLGRKKSEKLKKTHNSEKAGKERKSEKPWKSEKKRKSKRPEKTGSQNKTSRSAKRKSA